MKLFTTFKINNLELKNRIVMPPMDVFKSTDGFANEYHISHYSARAIGQVSLIIQESTAVAKDGRISSGDLGIWNDEFIPNLKQITENVHKLGSKIAIQLNHAGRKSRVCKTVYSASSIPFSDTSLKPIELSKQQIKDIIEEFKDAAIRAKKANYDMIEIHAAHGYLINQFISKLSNKRTDEYGGDINNRLRFLKEILIAVKSVWDKEISVRISAEEYSNLAATPFQLANGLKQISDLFDVIHVSSGGTINNAVIDEYPGYQIPLAKIIKEIVSKPVIGVGLIDTIDLANYLITNDNIDLIAIGRSLLQNPNWIIDQCIKNNCSEYIEKDFVNERLISKNKFKTKN